jgi:hypothetical protein
VQDVNKVAVEHSRGTGPVIGVCFLKQTPVSVILSEGCTKFLPYSYLFSVAPYGHTLVPNQRFLLPFVVVCS